MDTTNQKQDEIVKIGTKYTVEGVASWFKNASPELIAEIKKKIDPQPG